MTKNETQTFMLLDHTKPLYGPLAHGTLKSDSTYNILRVGVSATSNSCRNWVHLSQPNKILFDKSWILENAALKISCLRRTSVSKYEYCGRFKANHLKMANRFSEIFRLNSSVIKCLVSQSVLVLRSFSRKLYYFWTEENHLKSFWDT